MLKALIVEDNAFFRQTLRHILCAEFPEACVEEAEDGVEAWSKLAHLCPDLVLLDIQLPGESGLELARRIRHELPKAAIVICTSHDLPEYREAARKHGADHFLVKGGSTIDELLAVIAAIVARPGEAGRGERSEPRLLPC